MASLGDSWRWSAPLVTSPYLASKATVNNEVSLTMGELGPTMPEAEAAGTQSLSPMPDILEQTVPEATEAATTTLKRKRGGRKKAARQPTRGSESHDLIRDWLCVAHASLTSPDGGFPMTSSDEPTTEPPDELDFIKFAELAEISGLRLTSDCTTLNVDEMPQDDISHLFHAHIRNESAACFELNVLGHSYIIPAHASFICSDLSRAAQILKPLDPFDLIVMDPPWPNKSVQRAGHYAEIDIYDLFKIPGKRLARPGGYVAVWVTNRPKFQDFVRDKLFSAWGLALVGEWYWLKVTAFGEWVVPLETLNRKPYEILIVGQAKQGRSVHAPDFPNLPFRRAICSVPYKQHSRKPLVEDLFAPFLPHNPRKLELFARSVLRGWTAWGNEPLKFNDRGFLTKGPDAMQNSVDLTSARHDQLPD
ncbi:Methyltransferase-like protein 4 [Geranomyces michiganensis]|nr:Methyltransferase-like protein 4 [Geranomyces michiganensis]